MLGLLQEFLLNHTAEAHIHEHVTGVLVSS